jgi:hypothetical protein
LSRQAEPSGAADEKVLARALLGDVAFEVAGAAYAYAVNTGNKDLAGKVAITRSQVVRGRDAEVITRCKGIHAVATEYLESLSDYGVTQAKLTALKKKIDTFQNVQPKPRQGRTVKSAATQELNQLFKQVDEVLKDCLDRLVVQFTESAPTFVNEYFAARVVVLQPGTRAVESSAADATDSQPLSTAPVLPQAA